MGGRKTAGLGGRNTDRGGGWADKRWEERGYVGGSWWEGADGRIKMGGEGVDGRKSGGRRWVGDQGQGVINCRMGLARASRRYEEERPPAKGFAGTEIRASAGEH